MIHKSDSMKWKSIFLFREMTVLKSWKGKHVAERLCLMLSNRFSRSGKTRLEITRHSFCFRSTQRGCRVPEAFLETLLTFVEIWRRRKVFVRWVDILQVFNFVSQRKLKKGSFCLLSVPCTFFNYFASLWCFTTRTGKQVNGTEAITWRCPEHWMNFFSWKHFRLCT